MPIDKKADIISYMEKTQNLCCYLTCKFYQLEGGKTVSNHQSFGAL